MTHEFMPLGVASIVVAIDNALLAGLLLPSIPRRQKAAVVTTVAIVIALVQVLLAVGVGQLLNQMFYRAVAIVVLAWMATKLIGQPLPAKRASLFFLWVMLRVFTYTVIGNLDNIIWLGTLLDGQYAWLGFCSICTIPLFVMVSLFLSNQCEKHTWITFIGAGMMAWAAGSLFLGMPAAKLSSGIPPVMLQLVVAAIILCIGFSLRFAQSRGQRHGV